jgi:hypothetical protein
LRVRLRRGGAARPVNASAQIAKTSRDARVTAADAWRFASALVRPRAEWTTAFAPLSHMLMYGFFFNQGFDTGDLLLEARCSRAARPTTIGPRGFVA